MPRLIDADALLESLRESLDGLHGIYEGLQFLTEKQICGAQISCFHEIILRVKEAPTIEAEPVRHGRWSDDRYRYKCEGCGKWVLLEDGTADMNYCPECGRKMDGGAEE